MVKPSKIQLRFKNKTLIKSFLNAIHKTSPPSFKPWTGAFEIALRENDMNLLNGLYHDAGKSLPKVAAFLQQLSEVGQINVDKNKFIVELFATPLIFAAEIDKPGNIETKLVNPDLGPLTEIFANWFDHDANVIFLDTLHTKEEIEQQGANGLLHLRETLTHVMLSQKKGMASPLSRSFLVNSGIPGENWHLRYLVGLLTRPLTDKSFQLPKTVSSDKDKAALWSKRLGIYLNMHIKANGTGFDVMPLIPNQLSYAIEEGDASLCLLQMEHFAIPRSINLSGNKAFPVRASYSPEKRLIAITVGNNLDTIWDTTFPVWFIDEIKIQQAVFSLVKKYDLGNFDFIDFDTFVTWRRKLEQPATWLETL